MCLIGESTSEHVECRTACATASSSGTGLWRTPRAEDGATPIRELSCAPSSRGRNASRGVPDASSRDAIVDTTFEPPCMVPVTSQSAAPRTGAGAASMYVSATPRQRGFYLRQGCARRSVQPALRARDEDPSVWDAAATRSKARASRSAQINRHGRRRCPHGAQDRRGVGALRARTQGIAERPFVGARCQSHRSALERVRRDAFFSEVLEFPITEFSRTSIPG